MIIVAAAIQYADVVASLPRPARHHDIIDAWHTATGMCTRGSDMQGFLTSDGRFVSRYEALEIATAASQIVTKNGDPQKLFSEDMW